MFLNIGFFIFMWMCESLRICVCTIYMSGTLGTQRRASHPLELELEAESHCIDRPVSSARVASVLNH